MRKPSAGSFALGLIKSSPLFPLTFYVLLLFL